MSSPALFPVTHLERLREPGAGRIGQATVEDGNKSVKRPLGAGKRGDKTRTSKAEGRG